MSSSEDRYAKYADCKGVSDEDLTKAYRRHNRQQIEARDGKSGSSMQSSSRRYVGTPRNAKNKDFFGGIRIR